MLLTRRELPILIVNLVYIPLFTAIALGRSNYEFLLYVVVILIVAGLILWKQQKVRFDLPILWGLTIWGLLHMAGGNVHVGDDVLYGLRLLPIIDSIAADGERIIILRYDQLVHTFGFAVATLVCYHLLRPYLRDRVNRTITFFCLIAMMGAGVGALNELIEFLTVVLMPETGVGGYYNTLLDLGSNMIGAVLAAAWVTGRR